MKSILRAVVVAWLVASLSVPAAAKTCAGVSMSGSIDVGGTRLVLNGMGIREATVFQVDVYVAGLYLEKRSSDSSAIINSEQKKRLVMHFVRDVDRAKVHEAFREGLKNGRMTGAKVDQFLKMVPAVKVGTTISLTYLPGTGTVVHVGQSKKGVIDGSDFAKAWVSIYVGPKPPNPGLKRGLLGGACE